MVIQVGPHLGDGKSVGGIVGRERSEHVAAQRIVHHVAFEVVAQDLADVVRRCEFIVQDPCSAAADETRQDGAAENDDASLGGKRIYRALTHVAPQGSEGCKT